MQSRLNQLIILASMASLSFFGCVYKDKEPPVSKITHSYFPRYAKGDTLVFSDSTQNVRKFVVSSSERYIYVQTISDSKPKTEMANYKMERVGDFRHFVFESEIAFSKGDIFVVWENCISAPIEVSKISKFLALRINGIDFRKTVYINSFCSNTNSPVKLWYDLDSGVIAYQDSNQVRWELEPRK